MKRVVWIAAAVLLLLAGLGATLFIASQGYALVLRLNWNISLPPGRTVVSVTSGASFHGDGARYHVLEYADGSALEGALPWRQDDIETPRRETQRILKSLEVPSEQWPNLENAVWYHQEQSDGSSLYVYWDKTSNRVSVIEWMQ